LRTQQLADVIPRDAKRASVLRRLRRLDDTKYLRVRGHEGDVCAFALGPDAKPVVIEATCGRDMLLAPGDVFLGTPAFRESTRWVVGRIPKGGLIPKSSYWILAASGLVGELVGTSPLEVSHLGQVTYLGALANGNGSVLNIRQLAVDQPTPLDHGAPVYLILGTSAEVGKTTTGLVLLRALRRSRKTVIVLKATGTASLGELMTYRDFGAKEVFDCVDFGLPSTYPSERKGIEAFFDLALVKCFSVRADAILVECGGDMLGANVPMLISRLSRYRSRPKVILAAADALAALGATHVLRDMGVRVSLLTGPCTDTPVLAERTALLCGIPTQNMTQSGGNTSMLQVDDHSQRPRMRARTAQK
jgi:hypothetical protein